MEAAIPTERSVNAWHPAGGDAAQAACSACRPSGRVIVISKVARIADFEALQECVPPAGLPLAVHELEVEPCGAAERGFLLTSMRKKHRCAMNPHVPNVGFKTILKRCLGRNWVDRCKGSRRRQRNTGRFVSQVLSQECNVLSPSQLSSSRNRGFPHRRVDGCKEVPKIRPKRRFAGGEIYGDLARLRISALERSHNHIPGLGCRVPFEEALRCYNSRDLVPIIEHLRQDDRVARIARIQQFPRDYGLELRLSLQPEIEHEGL